MRYLKLEKGSVVNGEGIRAVLFCTGCEHHCKNCHNPQTWNKNVGEQVDINVWHQIEELLDDPFCNGLTISGGDPLAPYNADMTRRLAYDVKHKYPDKTVWVYTGYKWENLDKTMLDNIDVLVDGQFEQENRVYNEFRGSSNQRIIDVKESRDRRKIVLWR